MLATRPLSRLCRNLIETVFSKQFERILAMFPEQLPSYLKIRSEDGQQHSKRSVLPIRSRTELWLQFWLWIVSFKKKISVQRKCVKHEQKENSHFSQNESEKDLTFEQLFCWYNTCTHVHTSWMRSSTCELRTDVACFESPDEWSVSEQRGFGNPRDDKAKQRIAP